MTPGPGIEPRPQWWEASALTTVPSVLPSHDDRRILNTEILARSCSVLYPGSRVFLSFFSPLIAFEKLVRKASGTRVSAGYLQGICRVSAGYLQGTCRVSVLWWHGGLVGSTLEFDLKVSGSNLVSAIMLFP